MIHSTPLYIPPPTWRARYDTSNNHSHSLLLCSYYLFQGSDTNLIVGGLMLSNPLALGISFVQVLEPSPAGADAQLDQSGSQGLDPHWWSKGSRGLAGHQLAPSVGKKSFPTNIKNLRKTPCVTKKENRKQGGTHKQESSEQRNQLRGRWERRKGVIKMKRNSFSFFQINDLLQISLYHETN